MGAPDQAFLCRRGHLYQEISPYCMDDLFDESERIHREGCRCGEKSVVMLSCYSNINDCLEEDEHLVLIGGETFRWRERIPDAIDADGNPVEAYRDCGETLEVYDVSKLIFPDLREASVEG